jgi:hypothetical protein
LIDALIRAGEIETGLADAESFAADAMARVVDQLAAMACSASSSPRARSTVLAALAQLVDYPSEIRCAHPEGFSYYGLHPLDFADLVVRVHSHLKRRVAVIGIRSVGSTLGAVVVAALRARGTVAERVTVRPAGEPYERRVVFTPTQQRWIKEALRERADFVIVDEGPGFSGSTFLSVARALLATGVQKPNIVLLCSRPFPAYLDGTQSGRDWRLFRSYKIEYGRRVPRATGPSIGGGAWREILFPDRAQWPACWTDQERIKHLSKDGKAFFKFEGFGRYGHRSRQQASVLAHAGLSPQLEGYDNGCARYQFVRARPLSKRDLTPALLERLAAYCAFRASNFPAEDASTALLADMMRVNLGIELGIHDLAFEIPLERPVYPDCRMLPHEWLRTSRGEFLKTDSVGHGEGHQLPGPADIAWDLAGTIVEWQLPPAAADHFLRSYRRQSGDNAGARLPAYVLLYSVLRMAHSRMAAAGMVGSLDAGLLLSNYRYLRLRVKDLLEGPALASRRALQLQ